MDYNIQGEVGEESEVLGFIAEVDVLVGLRRYTDVLVGVGHCVAVLFITWGGRRWDHVRIARL